jgi:hypothetical protein
MKKSAIYLGACAAILAIAGAFTTKGSSKIVVSTGYTLNGSKVQGISCTGVQGTCKTSLNGQVQTLFTSPGSSNVIHTRP